MPCGGLSAVPLQSIRGAQLTLWDSLESQIFPAKQSEMCLCIGEDQNRGTRDANTKNKLAKKLITKKHITNAFKILFRHQNLFSSQLLVLSPKQTRCERRNPHVWNSTKMKKHLTNQKLLDSFHDLTTNNVREFFFFFPNKWIANSLQHQENLGRTGYNGATLTIRP